MNTEPTIKHDGDEWRIVAFGATRVTDADGQTFCHLISTTRLRKQRNGESPAQIADWIDWRVIQSALMQREGVMRDSRPNLELLEEAAAIAKAHLMPFQTAVVAATEANKAHVADVERAAYLARWANAPAEATHLAQDPDGRCDWFESRPEQDEPFNVWMAASGADYLSSDRFAGRNLIGRVACEPRPRELGGEG